MRQRGGRQELNIFARAVNAEVGLLLLLPFLLPPQQSLVTSSHSIYTAVPRAEAPEQCTMS